MFLIYSYAKRVRDVEWVARGQGYKLVWAEPVVEVSGSLYLPL